MALPGLVAINNLSDVVDREKAWDNLASNLATGDIAIPAPSLDLNFAANKSLVDDVSGNNLITFSRASSGTFVGSNGLIQTAASGVPRFDHNPTTGESLGLLMEEARTNSVTYSEEFNLSSTLTGVAIVSSVAISPNGTTTATAIVESAVNELHSVRVNKSQTGSCAASVFAKPNGRNFVFVQVVAGDFLLSRGVVFDLNAKTVVSAGTGFTGAIQSFSDGWCRLTVTGPNFVSAPHVVLMQNETTGVYTGDGVSGAFLWGGQLEAGSFPTSYIPTAGSTVTRAADVASITGANFSGWYNQSEGTLLAGLRTNTPANVNNGLIQFTDGTVNNRIEVQQVQSGDAFPRVSGLFRTSNVTTAAWTSQESGWIPNGQTVDKWALGFNSSGFSFRTTYDSTPSRGAGSYPQNLTSFFIEHRSTISRLVYWPSRLNDKTLQYITQLSISSIDVYSFSFTIKGRDVLALEDARNTSTRDFIFIKGLLSAAQPRLTAAAASTASGLALASNALLKLAPTSSGNYFFASGLTLSGVTTRINGTNALSIATSPFSGSTATAPLLFRELRPQANWRITEPMPSGTIASPEFAIPFETNDFVLFMKAGQN